MKKKMNTILSVLLMIAMLSTVTVVPAMAKEEPVYVAQNVDTGVQYQSLKAAVDAAEDGQTVKVIQDHKVIISSDDNLDDENYGVQIQSLNGDIWFLENYAMCDNKYPTYVHVEGKKVTIDLNDKEIQCEAKNFTTSVGLLAFFSTDNNGHLVLKDDGGKSKVEVTTLGLMYSLITNYEAGCSITIESGNYKLDKTTNQSLIYSGCGYKNSNSEYEGVFVHGGQFTLGNRNEESSDPWIFNVSGQAGSYVYITGGTYNDDVQHQSNVFEVEIPIEYALRDNQNGTWTIVPAICYVNSLYGNKNQAYIYEKGYASFEEALAHIDARTFKDITMVANKSYYNAPNFSKGIGSTLTIYGDFDANENNFDALNQTDKTAFVEFRDNCTITGDLVIPANVTVSIDKNANILGTLTNYGTINFTNMNAMLNVYGQMVNRGTVHFADGSSGSCINAYGKVINAKAITADDGLTQDAVVIRCVSVFGDVDGQYGVISEGEFIREDNSEIDPEISVPEYQTFYQASSGGFTEMLSNPTAMLKQNGAYTLYADLAKACADAEEGDTVILMKDGSGEELVPKDGVVITIDLNHYTLTAGENCYVFDYNGGVDNQGWSGVAYVVSGKTSDDLVSMVASRGVNSTTGKYFDEWNITENQFSASWKSNRIETIEYALIDGEHTYTVTMTDGTVTTFTVPALEDKLGEEVTKLQNQINANVTDIEGINASIVTINGLINALKKADEALSDDFFDAIAKLQDAVKALEDAKDNYVSADAKLKAELEELISDTVNDITAKYTEAIKNAKEELQAAIDKKADKTELTKAVADLEALIKAAEKAAVDADSKLKADLEKTISDTADAVTKAYTAAIEAAKKDLVALIDTKADKTALEKAVADLEALIEAAEKAAVDADAKLKADLEKAISDTADAVTKAYTAAIEAAKKELVELIDTKADKTALEKAVADLEALIKAAEKAAVDADAKLKAELEKTISDTADAVTKAYTAAIEAAKKDLVALIDTKADKTALEKAVADLEALIAAAEKAAVNADAKLKAELEKAISDTADTITEAYIAAIEAAKKELADLIDTKANNAELEKAIKDLEALIAAAEKAAADADAKLKAELEKAVADADAKLKSELEKAEADADVKVTVATAIGGTALASNIVLIIVLLLKRRRPI